MIAIYTAGYGSLTPARLKELVEELDAQLFDVRFSPMSRVPIWRGFALARQYGDRYAHLKAFGNAAYKTGGIQILGYEAGRAALERCERPAAILMCACKDYATCHRATLAQMLTRDGFTVQEIGAQKAQRVLL